MLVRWHWHVVKVKFSHEAGERNLVVKLDIAGRIFLRSAVSGGHGQAFAAHGLAGLGHQVPRVRRGFEQKLVMTLQNVGVRDGRPPSLHGRTQTLRRLGRWRQFEFVGLLTIVSHDDFIETVEPGACRPMPEMLGWGRFWRHNFSEAL